LITAVRLYTPEAEQLAQVGNEGIGDIGVGEKRESRGMREVAQETNGIGNQSRQRQRQKV